MAKDFKEKSDKELEKDLLTKREQLREFRFKLSGSQTRDLKEGKNLKKDIARILTEINNRHEK